MLSLTECEMISLYKCASHLQRLVMSGHDEPAADTLV